MEDERRKDVDHGPHQSTMAHIPFMRYDVASLVGKVQWVLLPYLVYKYLMILGLSPPGLKEEQDRRSRWIGDYIYSTLNLETLPISALSHVQYSWALDRLIREVVIADPTLRPFYVLKVDVINGFYHIGLIPIDAPNLVLVFPSYISGEDLVAIPLTLPMVWKKYPPIFCKATETVADLSNSALCCNQPSRKHKL